MRHVSVSLTRRHLISFKIVYYYSSRVHELKMNNKDEENGGDTIINVVGFRRSVNKGYIYILLSIVSLGFVWLVCYWFPNFWLYLSHEKCAMIDAHVVLITRESGSVSVEIIKDIHLKRQEIPACVSPFFSSVHQALHTKEHPISDDMVDDISPIIIPDDDYLENGMVFGRTMEHRKIRHFLNINTQLFETIPSFSHEKSLRSFLDSTQNENTDFRRLLHGENTIDILLKTYPTLLYEEILNPFYIFQVYSLAVWLGEDYYDYAVCIFIIACFSIAMTLRETRNNIINLRNMVGKTICITRETLSGATNSVDSSELLPGDVIHIPKEGCIMPCDAVLLSSSCIVNESMLTGESVPVTKFEVMATDELYSTQAHRAHTLFSGTNVLQTRGFARAMIIRTGFATAKGQLVRAILFPKPTKFKFFRDSMRFILVLAIVGFLGFIYSIIVNLRNNMSSKIILLRCLDIFTVVVPPLLPAAMAVGVAYAMSRLKNHKIFCISPPRINMAGKIKLFCFDKTGTLTEDTVSLHEILPATPEKFLQRLSRDQIQFLPSNSKLLQSLASCHSLAYVCTTPNSQSKGKEPPKNIHSSIRDAGLTENEPSNVHLNPFDSEIEDDNILEEEPGVIVLVGDPLDIELFKLTDWQLEEPEQIEVKHNFPSYFFFSFLSPQTSLFYFAHAHRHP